MKKNLILLTLSIACCLAGMAQSQHFDPIAATQQYLDQLPAASKAKSDAYFEGGYWLLLWNILYETLVAWVLLSAGLSQWIKKRVARFRSLNLQNLSYAILYLFAAFLLHFPINFYQNFIREHTYDLSNQTFIQWLSDNLIALSLTLVMGGLGIMVMYIILRMAKKTWWVWGAGVVILFTAFFMVIAPVFVSPLFNKYTPLTDEKLKGPILSMARANQVPADNVYEFDASRQSDRISANVSGLGNTTRISLNDNLLKQCTLPQIKSVMGHELGHYVLNHVYKGLMEMGVVIFIGFAFLNRAFKKFTRRYNSRWHIEDISDIGGLPLLMFLFSLYMFFATPVTNTIIRTEEIEADMFGLNAAREPDGFAAIAMKLSTYRKIDPGYWEEIFFFDHPSGRSRVLSAMKWKAEHLNE
jgi:STE24 endopeptidase